MFQLEHTKTHEEIILDLLKPGHPVSGRALAKAIGGGDVQARLGSLRARGYVVESKRVANDVYNSYKLVGFAEDSSGLLDKKAMQITLPSRRWTREELAELRSILEREARAYVSELEGDKIDLLEDL